MQSNAYKSSVITGTSGHFHNDTFDAVFVCLSLKHKQHGRCVAMSTCYVYCHKENAGVHI